jgi:peroxiredoxin
MIDDFGNGPWEPSVEPLLRKVAAESPHDYVRAAALYRLARYLHRDVEAYPVLSEWAATYDREWYERMIAIQKTESAKEHLRRQRDQWTAAAERVKGFDPVRAREEAMQLLERVLDEYADVKTPQYRVEGPAFVRFVRGREPSDWGAVEMAEALHFQLTRLGLGQEAPEIEGEDLDDQPFKLSDYRGRVVVLTVGHALGTDTTLIEKCSALLAKHEGQPLAVLSVVWHQPAHPYYAENTARDGGITWRVFRDPTPQRIQRLWCQETSPEVYVLDRQGIIRFHGDRGRCDLEPLVKELLDESS